MISIKKKKKKNKRIRSTARFLDYTKFSQYYCTIEFLFFRSATSHSIIFRQHSRTNERLHSTVLYTQHVPRTTTQHRPTTSFVFQHTHATNDRTLQYQRHSAYHASRSAVGGYALPPSITAAFSRQKRSYERTLVRARLARGGEAKPPPQGTME